MPVEGLTLTGSPAALTKLMPVMFPVAEIEAIPEADTPKRPKLPKLLKVKLPLLATPKTELTLLLKLRLTSVPAAERRSVVSGAA